GRRGGRSRGGGRERCGARGRDRKTAPRLNAKATEMLDKLKAGTPLAEVAAADKLKVASVSGLKRGEGSGALSAAAVDAVFRTAKDAAGKGDAAQPTEQIVFPVTDIVVPKLDTASEDAKPLVEPLNRGLSEDVFSEYVARLENEIGVTINQAALNQVVTGGAATDEN